MPGDKHNRQLLIILMKQRHQVDAGAAGHADIAQHNTGPVLLHPLPRRKGIIAGMDVITRLLKQLRIGIQHVAIIINQQNRTLITQHHLHPLN